MQGNAMLKFKLFLILVFGGTFALLALVLVWF